MKRINTILARMSTGFLVAAFYFLFVVSLSLVGPLERLGGYSHLYLFSFAFFLWGLAGIPMIIRREAQPFFERGGWAVALGILHLVFGWGMAFTLLIYNLFFRQP